MAPSPQEQPVYAQGEVSAAQDGERVVISGMSGLFPQAHHVQDLSDILYEKKNPISNENIRWKFNHPEVAHYTGKVPGLNKFDAQFFKVHYRLASNMDSMSRKVLEQAYQAIYDAGVSPNQLWGKKVGVYIGTCLSETEKAVFYGAVSTFGFGIAGCNKSMFANRISYWLNVKGPSMSIDVACCSSLGALEQAYLAMTRGECEAAIIGGANLCLHPQSSIHYGRIMSLCADGKTKSFDQHADGCAKSEAINVLFLQKAKDARRVYAEVLHVKTGFTAILPGEIGPRYGFYRNLNDTAEFIQNFYQEVKILPQAVEYVEAFGSAVSEADKSELSAIEKVFCKNRSDQLLVGSVMSNIGYGEAASGISAITKVLLGYHKGELAANLHCDTPRQDIAALGDGRMRIVTEHQPFRRTYTAVNAMSITGVNAHVLLHGHYKPKDLNRYKATIPRLVAVSGRQESSVNKVLQDLKSRTIDPEEHALLHHIHENNITGHLGRGFIILDTNEEQKTVSLCEKADYFDDAERPLWFVYSGMGSQWAGMGAQLMRIPVFAAAIERCRIVLEPRGVDIVNIITSTDKSIFDNILHSFVGIAAVQIGLTDVLRALGLVPDKVIGHSVGELGCAYADGCFTAEEMILAAYSRGLVSVQTSFIRGSMAAVGVGFQEIIKLCPTEIEVACHNGPESCTISGPADKMREFVAELTAKKIFAKEVPCSNIAYHSRYIAEAGPGLLMYLKEVIKDPKPRSERWLSTSVPKDKWDQLSAKYSSAEYHTNNLLSPVLFEETSRLVPANAVLVEVAPHGLLQAILKRSLPAGCRNIPLTRRGHPDNAYLLLEAVGSLYMEGYNPKIKALYPQVEFPVSTGTPFLSHLVEWAHTENWSLPLYVSASKKIAAASKCVISLYDEEHAFLKGNCIRGKTLYPFAGALVAAWDTLAMTLGVDKKALSVHFRDVHLYAQPLLHPQRQLRLSVALHRGTGRFEIMNDTSKVATGFIKDTLPQVKTESKRIIKKAKEETLNPDEIYQLLFERDYSYSGEFRSLRSVNTSLTEADIAWSNNWVTFLDGVLQLNALRHAHETVSQVCQIRRLCIDVEEHAITESESIDGITTMKANVCLEQDSTRCGGILIDNIKFNDLPLAEEKVELQALKVIPRFLTKSSVKPAVQTYVQVVAENLNRDTISVIEVTGNKSPSLSREIREIMNSFSRIQVTYEMFDLELLLQGQNDVLSTADMIIIDKLSHDDNLCHMLSRVMQPTSFIMEIRRPDTEARRKSATRCSSALLHVVSLHTIGDIQLALARWKMSSTHTATSAVSVRTPADLKLLATARASLPPQHRLLVLAIQPAPPTLRKLIAQWRKQSDNSQIYLIETKHAIAAEQHLDNIPEINLAYNVLDHGVWGGEYFVTAQELEDLEEKQNAIMKNAVTLQISKFGDLDSLHWVTVPEPTDSHLMVKVHYAGINNLDALKASGIPLKIKPNTAYGMDFSGITDSGARVMGIVSSGAASSRVRARPELLWPVPAHWSLEDAATVPLAYAQAFYCLAVKNLPTHNVSLLVHGGAGALGQAAISIALGLGYQVFTTVSDIHKKRFLCRLFPELKEDHIGNSRDHSFGDMVMLATGGKGCNIVINSLKGELKNTSLTCCASSGIIFDTVQVPTKENFMLGLSHLTNERNYFTVDFASIFAHDAEQQRLQYLISEGITRGYVRPLSRVTYEPPAVSRAFRLLTSSRHRGRVLLRLQDGSLPAQLRLTCTAQGSHVVVCDDGLLGLQLVDRLIQCGARNVFLHCELLPAHVSLKIRMWQNVGAIVKVFSAKLRSSSDVTSLLLGAAQLGPVEGVYVAVTTVDSNTSEHLTRVLADLDSGVRALCSHLRIFGVLKTDDYFGLHTCLARAQNRLPVTLLSISKANGDKDMFWYRMVVEATERALCSSYPVLVAARQSRQEASLLHQLASVAEIKIPDNTPITSTLEDLGLKQENLKAVSFLLQDVYNVYVSEEQIMSLTIESINQLSMSMSNAPSKQLKGLESLFSYVDSDELLATTEMVFLPTLTNSAILIDDEFDVSQTHLCVIPGLEGHHERFRVLCERLKLPALVMQPGLDCLHETVQQSAQRFANVLLKRAGLKNNFYLLGYESGVLNALEMASFLEEYGLTGTVFCLGGGPDEILGELEAQLDNYRTEEELKEAVLRHMYGLMAGGNTAGLDDALRGFSDWSLKLEACIRSLLGRVPHSAQYARALIEAAYARLSSARSYTAQPRPLRSRIVLLRAALESTPAPNVPKLQHYSQQPITVHQLTTPLARVSADLQCTAIINKNLDSILLEAFERGNLCERYLLASSLFTEVTDE